MRYVLSLAVGALLLLSFGGQQAAAQAECTAIDQPLEDYLAGSEKCSFGEVLFSMTTTCQDVREGEGNVEATFSNPLSVRRIGSGWATWSDPPESEESMPWVAFNESVDLTVTLTEGLEAGTAGMEIENNVFEPAMPISVAFLNANGDELITITRDVLGRAGARLFAATCLGDTISQMVVTSDPAARGFAIAQVRANSFAPLAGATPQTNPRNSDLSAVKGGATFRNSDSPQSQR